MERPDPSNLRISDSDRHKVAEVLREAAAEGRIDVEELEERLEATYAAKTYGDLVPITIDLPGHPQGAGGTPAVRPSGRPAVRPRYGGGVAHPGPSYDSSLAIMSETKRVGVWTVPEQSTAVAVMGSVVLDLREADFAAGEVLINASAVMGSVEVLVDAETVVRVDGVGVMGAYEMGRESVSFREEQDSPVVVLKGFALMGAVEVKRKGPPKRRRR